MLTASNAALSGFPGSIEQARARELDAQLGPKHSDEPACDFIIDLHNTTAATGVALLLAPTDCFAQEVAHYLTQLDPSVVVSRNFERAACLLCGVHSRACAGAAAPRVHMSIFE